MDTVQAAINRGGDPNLPALLRQAGFSQVRRPQRRELDR